MSDIQHARRRVTYNQLQNLWEFLDEHREIASGYNKSAQAREHSKQMWRRAASILYSGGEGAIKSGPEWSKYWVDLKAKIKRKNRIIRDAQSRTGGGPCTEQELSEIDLKFLQILGEDYGSGLPGVQVHPFVTQQENEATTSRGPSQSTHIHESDEAIYLVVESGEHEVDHQSERNMAFTEGSFSLHQPSTSSAQILPPQPSTSCAQTPPPHQRSTSFAQIPPPHQPSTASTQIPPSQQPSTSSAQIQLSLLQPSASPTPPDLTQRDAHIAPEPPQLENHPPQRLRRRQRRQRPLTAAAARAQLVAASEARAQAELANSRYIAQAVGVLGEIASVLRRIEARLPCEAPIGE